MQHLKEAIAAARRELAKLDGRIARSDAGRVSDGLDVAEGALNSSVVHESAKDETEQPKTAAKKKT